MNRLPRWLQRQSVSLHPQPWHVFLGNPMKPVMFPTRAERALALRSLMLFAGKEAGDVQAPDWLRQLAAVSMFGVSTELPRVTLTSDGDGSAHGSAHGGTRPLEMGSLLIAHNPASKKKSVAHCEARIIEQLRREPVELLERLSPLVFYTVLFPCPACADTIGQVLPSTCGRQQPCQRQPCHRHLRQPCHRHLRNDQPHHGGQPCHHHLHHRQPRHCHPTRTACLRHVAVRYRATHGHNRACV